jgi:hypothetical protein
VINLLDGVAALIMAEFVDVLVAEQHVVMDL